MSCWNRVGDEGDKRGNWGESGGDSVDECDERGRCEANVVE